MLALVVLFLFSLSTSVIHLPRAGTHLILHSSAYTVSLLTHIMWMCSFTTSFSRSSSSSLSECLEIVSSPWVPKRYMRNHTRSVLVCTLNSREVWFWLPGTLSSWIWLRTPTCLSVVAALGAGPELLTVISFTSSFFSLHSRFTKEVPSITITFPHLC